MDGLGFKELQLQLVCCQPVKERKDCNTVDRNHPIA